MLKPLPEDFEATRSALHTYAQAAIAPSRAHGIAHPKWWHVSLKPRPDGLASDPIPLPGGGAATVRLDLVRHSVVVDTNRGPAAEISMTDGTSGTEMGDAVLAAVAALGLEGDYDRSKFESDEPTSYSTEDAGWLLDVFLDAYGVFEAHRVAIDRPASPVQVWPHGFDISFEWFGTRTQEYEGEELPSQLNLGFYPKGRAYFYSNPWPFDDGLTSVELPHGAEWHTENWQGSILFYDKIAGDPAAGAKLAEYAKAVYDAAAPTLTT